MGSYWPGVDPEASSEVTAAEEAICDRLGPEAILPGVSLGTILKAGIRSLDRERLPLKTVHDVYWEIETALRQKRPFSMVRVGDGEAIFMARGCILTDHEADALGPFLHSHGVFHHEREARADLIAGVMAADIVGLPRSRRRTFQPLAAAALDAAGVAWRQKRLTNSLVNFELQEHGYLGVLLRRRRVLVVGGPAVDLAKRLQRQGFDVAGAVAPFATYEDLDAVLSQSAAVEWDVALVSCGVGSLALCPRLSKLHGAVVLDLGHVADALLEHPVSVRTQSWPQELSEQELYGLVASAYDGDVTPPPHVRRQSVQGSGAYSVARYQIWYNRHGYTHYNCVIAKMREPQQLQWEARVLTALAKGTPMRVPKLMRLTDRALVTEEIFGEHLARDLLSEWTTLAEYLARFHAQPPAAAADLRSGRPWSQATFLDRVAWTVESMLGVLPRLPRASAEGKRLGAMWSSLQTQVPKDPFLVFAHGDLQPYNVLVDDRQNPRHAWLDWEDSGEKPDAFDVSSCILKCLPMVRQEFVRAYAAQRAECHCPCSSSFVDDVMWMIRVQLTEKMSWMLWRWGDASEEPDPVAWRELQSALKWIQASPIRP